MARFTLAIMNEAKVAGAVLAAAELVPGEPDDLTHLLLDAEQRAFVLRAGGVHDDDIALAHASTISISPLAEYLGRCLDLGRAEHWTKVVERGIRDQRFRPVVVWHDDYPRGLRTVWDAPSILFRSFGSVGSTHSTTSGIDERSLAIVGGRDATAEVLTATRSVAAEVAASGVRVVSGLAAGVDTAAHVGALSADGATTAVLGTGIDHVFPEENRQLAQQIERDGVLLSQFTPPAPRTRTTFLRRNRVIAAMSNASLVMDGRADSGSRHEVRCAAAYGRRVLLWEPALANESWAEELNEGGRATFVTTADEVLAHLALSGR